MADFADIPVHDDPDAVARWVWRNLVPKSGQSAWVQGELLRCVEKLAWEAQDNGNANWDRDFEMIADYLEETLCGEPAFSDEARCSIQDRQPGRGDCRDGRHCLVAPAVFMPTFRV